ncbi:hypothetical protein [Burkholderia cenocepacia]|uniref:hypothetical protein n=1 Tax=Burkholderia cenocepacia TaxID=95486 RepID=UPI0012370FB2|nr:hypothetical protein [Burkholderia cenocepacia]
MNIVIGLTILTLVILTVSLLTKWYLNETAKEDAARAALNSREVRRGIERELRSLELEAQRRRLSRDENERFSVLIEQRNAVA